MFKIVQHNGVLTVRKASKKMTADEQFNRWLDNRHVIDSNRINKVVSKDRREYARHVNKQNRRVNAKLRADQARV